MPPVTTIAAVAATPHSQAAYHPPYDAEADLGPTAASWDIYTPARPPRRQPSGVYPQTPPSRSLSYGSMRPLWRQNSDLSDVSVISSDVARQYSCASVMQRHTWMPTALFAACILGAFALGQQLGCVASGANDVCPSRAVSGFIAGGIGIALGLGVITLVAPRRDLAESGA